MAMISTLNEYVTEGIKPDIYILLDIDPAKGLGRAGKPQMEMALGDKDRTSTSRTDEHNERRFEDQPLAFHNRVRRGYLQLAKDDPTWKTLNADQSPDDVEQQIWGGSPDRPTRKPLTLPRPDSHNAPHRCPCQPGSCDNPDKPPQDTFCVLKIEHKLTHDFHPEQIWDPLVDPVPEAAEDP